MYSHIKIICPEHGEFKQLPVKHIVGHGCIICNLANAYNLLRLSKNEFIKRATKIHGDRYDYSKVIYSNNRTCVNIICKEHGSFWQRPDSHMRRGAGCPKCLQSHGEREVSNYLNSIDIKYLTEYRFPNCKAIRPLPFDFYLPDLNICIEYDGLQHFKKTIYSPDLIKRQKYDQIKNDYCISNNIKLIRIPYRRKVEKYLSILQILQ